MAVSRYSYLVAFREIPEREQPFNKFKALVSVRGLREANP